MFKKSETFDIVGIICSGACALHCLMVPILVAFAPSFTVFLENEWIHKGLVISLIPVALIAFVRGHKKHGKLYPLILGGVGMLVLVSAILLEDLGIEGFEKSLTLMGSAMLVTAHYFNLKS